PAQPIPGPAPSGVTVLLHTRPRAGKEQAYARWQAGINAAAATFAGFQEARVFPAQPPYQPDWAVAYSFDTPARLRAWLDSAARREWLEKGEPLFEQTGERRLAGGFGSWFAPVQDAGPAAVPPGWKQVMTVLLALYPTVMLIGILIEPSLARILPKPAWMFITNLISVGFLQYLAMKVVNRLFRFWLVPGPAPRARANVIGTLIVLTCYAVSIAIFLAVARQHGGAIQGH